MKNKTKRQTTVKCLSPARILLLIPAILLCLNGVWAQEKETEPLDIPASNLFKNCEKLPAYDCTKELSIEDIEPVLNGASFAVEREREKAFAKFVKNEIEWRALEKNADERGIKDVPGRENHSQIKDKDKFHWKPALIQSGILLGAQHGYRLLAQPGTRRELRGPFFRDWAQSAKNLRGWNDGNRFFINYIGHPLQGAATGQIFVNNSDRAKKQEFGKSKEYWASRFKALVWSTVWSTQFELGPISEASLGNVGLRRRGRYSTMAYVDLVITPVLGTGVVVAEDAIDKYVLKNWLERKTSNKVTGKIKILRSFLTPTASIANLLRGKKPWKRENR